MSEYMRSCTLSSALLLLGACSEQPAQDNSRADAEQNLTLSDFNEPTASPETSAQRKKRLREKAKTDPEGADAEAISHMSRNEVIATAINTAGFLCARVLSAYPVGGNINVECVEYRSGEGRAKYTIDPNSGTVEQR